MRITIQLLYFCIVFLKKKCLCYVVFKSQNVGELFYFHPQKQTNSAFFCNKHYEMCNAYEHEEEKICQHTCSQGVIRFFCPPPLKISVLPNNFYLILR